MCGCELPEVGCTGVGSGRGDGQALKGAHESTSGHGQESLECHPW